MNLLTICIPTYNRSGFLDKALNALLPQVAAFAEKGVRAYVSSNCSTDDTDEVAKKYLARYNNVMQYVRQPQMNPHHISALAHCVQSKYVALMGDDDFVMPGYIDRILACIAEHPDVGLINYNVINYRDEKCLGLRDPMFCDGKAKFYEQGGEFIKEHHHIPSLMSSNVFVLEDYLEAQKTFNDDDYPGYEWYMALLKSVIHKPCYYIDTPMIWANCPLNVSWEKDSLRVFMAGLGRLFKDLDAEYPGLYENWMKVFQTTWFRGACIEFALKYRDTTSRQYFDEIIQYAYSPEYAKLLKICVFYPQFYVRMYLRLKNRFSPFVKRHLGMSD